jgi:hypothetical protein
MDGNDPRCRHDAKLSAGRSRWTQERLATVSRTAESSKASRLWR